MIGYACPNGHPFYVDLCGRPTVIQVPTVIWTLYICEECFDDNGFDFVLRCAQNVGRELEVKITISFPTMWTLET
jgi:hypothetical protein